MRPRKISAVAGIVWQLRFFHRWQWKHYGVGRSDLDGSYIAECTCRHARGNEVHIRVAKHDCMIVGQAEM